MSVVKMFACIYFPEDNTLSVVKESHKTVSCEKFIKGEMCEVKWKGKPFSGTIISTGERENEVKKTMHRLLRKVLNKFEGEDPVPQLLREEACGHPDESESGREETGTCKRKRSEVASKKETSKAPKQTSCASYADMMAEGSSLLDTWRLIQGKDNDSIPSGSEETRKDFMPSPELRSILQRLMQPTIQKEIREMLRFLDSKDDYQVLNMEQQHYNSTVLPFQSQQESYLYSPQPRPHHSMPQPVFYDSYNTGNYTETSFSLNQDIQKSDTWLASSYTSNNYFQSQQPMQSTTQHSNSTASLEPDTHTYKSQIPTPIHYQNTPIQSTSCHDQCQGASTQSPSAEVRCSPRKKSLNFQEPLVAETDADVKLTGDVKVPRKVLRNALASALKNSRPAFTLMAKLLQGVFTTSELANSRGQGIVKPKQGDTRPLLDATKIKACKDYVLGWARGKGERAQETELNDAVTEQTAYARKKLKKELNR